MSNRNVFFLVTVMCLLASQSVWAMDQNINACDAEGLSLLHHACIAGNLEQAENLIAAGTDVNIQSTKGDVYFTEMSRQHKNRIATPLHYAVGNGNTSLVKLLLEAGADINSTYDINGNTPTHIAVWFGFTECLQLLIDCGADLGIQNNCGSTPIHSAVWRHQPKCLIILLDHRAPFTERNNTGTGNTPLYLAAKSGSVECLRILLARDKQSINLTCATDHSTPLHIAAGRCQAQCCWDLIRMGAWHTKEDFKKNNRPSDFANFAMMKNFLGLIEKGGKRSVARTCISSPCGLCKCKYQSNDVLVLAGECGHGMHFACFKNLCIDQYLEENSGHKILQEKSQGELKIELQSRSEYLNSVKKCPFCRAFSKLTFSPSLAVFAPTF